MAETSSIPTKILRLLTCDISKHLSINLNISFATRIFPEKLKVAKVIPAHKKDSKLECSNYRPISLLSSNDKIIKKLMHNRLMKFLTEQKSFISNGLALGRIFTLLMSLQILLIVSRIHLARTNLCARFSLTYRKHWTQLIMRSYWKSCGIME